METILVLLLVTGAVAAVWVGVWWFLKQRYIKSLEALGYQWVESPGIEISFGLNQPPFGQGFGRSVDDQVLGRSMSGVPFSAFRYRCDGFRSSDYVVTMPLPKSLPAAYVFLPGQGHPAVTGASVATHPFQVVAADAEFGRRFWQAIAGVAGPGPVVEGGPLGIDLTVDHDRLVYLRGPRAAAGLQASVEWLAAVHAALVGSSAMGFDGPQPPPFLSFTERPDWEYIPRDDYLLDHVAHNTGGHSHEAVDIIRSENRGLPFIRLTHKWQTTHTRTDSKGNTTTYTENHEEDLCEFRTPFQFPDLSFNMGWFRGQRVQFESADFNRQFKVTTNAQPKFAYDVVHPRMMEFLMRARPAPFAFEGDGRIVVESGQWTIGDVVRTDAFLRAFLGRVPDFVYKQLGAWPRPLPEVEDYNS